MSISREEFLSFPKKHTDSMIFDLAEDMQEFFSKNPEHAYTIEEMVVNTPVDIVVNTDPERKLKHNISLFALGMLLNEGVVDLEVSNNIEYYIYHRRFPGYNFLSILKNSFHLLFVYNKVYSLKKYI